MGSNIMYHPRLKPKRALVYILIILIAGCATYGAGINNALNQVRQGNYTQAEQTLAKKLKPEGNDALLYYFENGSLQQLAGHHAASNQLLETANRLAEDLEVKRASEGLASLITNPRLAPYRGQRFEKIYLNYLKAMNFMLLAEQATTASERTEALEKARIEARRLDIKLTELGIQKGSYKALKEEKEKLFSKLVRIFEILNGQYLDRDKLIFRDNAYLHYLNAVLYEKNGELDGARLEYQRAAESYEEGYREQYSLDQGITEQAWFDCIRVMRLAGGWENRWPKLARDKLSQARRQELDRIVKDKNLAQLVMIEHVGLMPQRGELNFSMSIDANAKSLVLVPQLTGTANDRRAQMAWFSMLYSDLSILNLTLNYANNGPFGVATSFFTKTVPLGPGWQLAESIGLPQAISQTYVRVTVPYYAPFTQVPGGSYLKIGNQSQQPMILSESPARIALQEQIYRADREIQEALARESLKIVAAYQLTQAGNNPTTNLLFQIGALTNAATSAAETRNWLMLPHEIRLRRHYLPAGQHQVQLINSNGLPSYNELIDLTEGQIKLVNRHSF